MKIALLGYGKMGKVIETIALKRGHEIVLKKDKDNSFDGIENADVAIDFSTPDAATQNIKKALDCGIPIISGTTGWLQQYDEIVEYCKEKQGAFIYASNFSLGVNIFFELNKYLSEMMSKLDDYSLDIEEIHHTLKLDSPSGTAITLANDIIKNSNYTAWTLDKEPKENELPIVAKRIDNVPGTHTVTYSSNVDTIEIKHTAHNRNGFALGAVIASEWIFNKKGIFSMKDVLNLKNNI